MAPEETKRRPSGELAVPHKELALAEAEASAYFERNTFIDFPVLPMARPSTPSSSLPAGFLQRFLVLPQKSKTEALPLGAPCSTECSETDAMEILATLEELPGKLSFGDFPPCATARPPTSASSASPGNQVTEVVEASEISSKCSDCGNILLPDGNFCRKCGKRRPDASIDLDTDRGSPALSSPVLPATEQPSTEQLAGVGLPCIGSASHQQGKCSPCAWFWKSGGCRSGVTCTYCHLCPEGTRKAMKKAKVALLREQAESLQQQLEPAYVRPVCESAPPSPLSLASVKEVDEATVHFAENEQGEAVAPAPVKVSVKNTFIQLEVPSSPKSTSEPPSRTAPGDFFRRFFKTMEPEVLPSATPETPTSFHDSGFDSRPAADASVIASMPSYVDPEHNINGPQAHAVGQCTPCAYFWYKGDGCRKGEECEMCHLCPKGEIKRRKKARVQQLKAVGAYMPGFSQVRTHLDR